LMFGYQVLIHWLFILSELYASIYATKVHLKPKQKKNSAFNLPNRK
jgi:hypothetical protein